VPESHDNLRLEIGHVLFIDIVGYSKLLTEEQKERLGQLTSIVLGTAQVRDSSDEQLVRLPTGDGMALVFRRSAEEPARCALEIAEALQKHPELPVRMGIHSGPVSEMTGQRAPIRTFPFLDGFKVRSWFRVYSHVSQPDSHLCSFRLAVAATNARRGG